MKKPDISINNLRWHMHLKNGKIIVENHDHGRTWKKVLKDNYGNITALCFQLIPEGTKYYIDESPYNEYWQFEEFDVQMGGTPVHVNRNLCSKQKVTFNEHGIAISTWLVLRIDNYKNVERLYMTDEDIGYQSINSLNKQERLAI